MRIRVDASVFLRLHLLLMGAAVMVPVAWRLALLEVRR
jgi:hypothetical protein